MSRGFGPPPTLFKSGQLQETAMGRLSPAEPLSDIWIQAVAPVLAVSIYIEYGPDEPS